MQNVFFVVLVFMLTLSQMHFYSLEHMVQILCHVLHLITTMPAINLSFHSQSPTHSVWEERHSRID